MSVMRNNDRLHIRSICFGRIGIYAIFDRKRQIAHFFWLATIIPFRHQAIAFSEIKSVQARKREQPNGEAFYGLTVQRRIGDNIRFACTSRKYAMHLMQTIKRFLEQE